MDEFFETLTLVQTRSIRDFHIVLMATDYYRELMEAIDDMVKEGTISANDLKLVEEQLMKIRPYVRKINSSQYIEDLANGDLCIAVGYSGDVLQSRDRAAEAANGVTVAYSVPKEGTIIWFDMMSVPADAKHPKNAHLFMDYLMQPEVAAANSNAVNYANGNLASETLIDDAVKNDPGVYPPAEVKAKLSPELAVADDYNRLLTRTWTRFQTGK